MGKKGWRNEEIEIHHDLEAFPVPIVADGAIATTAVMGRKLIPVLLLDTRTRPDIDNLIKTQKIMNQGEVTRYWGRNPTKDKGPVTLLLRFTKPTVCTVLLHFDPCTQGGLLDQIIQAEAFYIMGAEPGERLGPNIDRAKILVEVSSCEFRDEWDRIWDDALRQDWRANGLSRNRAKQYSKEFRKEWRKLGAAFDSGAWTHT